MHTSAGAVVAPVADERTDYEYNSSNQLVKVIKPLPEGQTTRPEVSYTWASGQLYSMTNESSQTTTYTFRFDRPIEGNALCRWHQRADLPPRYLRPDLLQGP